MNAARMKGTHLCSFSNYVTTSRVEGKEAEKKNLNELLHVLTCK